MRPASLSSRRSLLIFRHFLLAVLFVVAISAQGQTKPESENALRLTSQPISFEPNRGQVSPPASFVARAANLAVTLRPRGLDLHVGGATGNGPSMEVNFVGGNSRAEAIASDQRASYSNYILGNDPSRWLSHIPNFGRVTYKSIYPGVDAVFYGNRERLEHDFIVAPGADYHIIRVRLDGPKDLELQADGNLKLGFPDGGLIFGKPAVYQRRAGQKKLLRGRYVLLAKNEFGFEVTNYDRSRPLIIDPVLTYSTYVADLSVIVSGVAADAQGDTFVTGLTFSSNFPVTSGAFQSSCKSCPNNPDVFVTKVNASGTGLSYSTLIGGGDYDQPAGIAVDKNGNAVVAGYTRSVDFPVKNPAMAVFPGNGSLYAFISSLSADGSTLNYSSLLGGGAQAGSSSMSYVGGVAVDANNNAYFSGITDSAVFPVTALNMKKPAYPNDVVFVTKFLPTGNLGYSALLGDVSPQNGGGGPIGVMGIAVDSSGGAYIAGSGGSLWPTTPGAFQAAIPGATPYAAPFVAKVSADGSTLAYSTFLGDGGYPTAITVKPTGEAFVTGDYATSNFPTTANAYEKTIGASLCCPAFLTEFNATGSQLLYSSYFSGSLSSGIPSSANTTGIALDGADNVWLSGFTTDSYFPLKYPLQSVPAIGSVSPTTNTGFVSQFDSAGAQLLFSSYFGGTVQGGMVAGVAIDPHNKAHIAGTTGTGLFTTPSAYVSLVTPAPQFVEYLYGYAAVIDTSVPAPAVCLNSQGINFGDLLVGTTTSYTFTVTNCGTSQLTINSIASSNSIFTVPAASNGCQQSVAVNSSCNFTVNFAPTSVGGVSAMLTVRTNAPISNVVLPLNGIGAVPQIQVQNTSITFDPQFIGQTSPPAYVWISNVGTVPLHIDFAHTSVSAGFAYDPSTCAQPLYQGQGSFCVLMLTFTPTSAGKLTGTLRLASDDPASPTVVITLTGMGSSSYPVPALSGTNPPTVPVGSTFVTLQVFGNNFFPSSVVFAAGIALQTTYQSSTTLTAALDASRLTLGEIPITVFNPVPGGGESASLPVTTYQSIGMAAVALVYNPVTKLLYAAIHAGAASNPNTIAVVDPTTAKVNAYITVGNDPRKLALSSDGQYLYVSLNGDHAIQRVNLSTLKVDQTFALPVDSSFGQLTAADMKVIPGSPQSVVVALFRVASPAEDGIALYNNGKLVNWLPNDGITANVAVDSFDFTGTPPVIYALPLSIGSPGNFGVFTVDIAGIHVQSTGTPGTTQQNTGSIVLSDGKLLYTNSGQVWNPSPQTLVATYNPPLFYAASVVPDSSAGRTFFLDPFATYSQYQATSVEAYDQTSLTLKGVVPFPSASVYGPDTIDLTRWGTDGFAFVVGDFIPYTDSNQLIIFRSSISGATTGQNPAPALTSLGTSSVTAGSAGFVLSVTGSNFVSGSVVQWNGSARPTTFVSSTQLTANISAADVAQPGTALITVANPAPGGGLSAPLSFSIIAASPVASLNPTSLVFGSQTVGSSSTALVITFTNSGGSPLTISAVQSSGDFAESSTCLSTLAPLASCTISVTFTPTATGSRRATVTVTDSATNSPQTVPLSGTGVAANFSFGTSSPTATTATVTAGQTATYSLSLVPDANFSGTVNLICAQVPANAHCTVNPSSLALASGKSVSFTVTVATTSSTSASLIPQLHILSTACGFGLLLGFSVFKKRGNTTRPSNSSFWMAFVVFVCLCVVVDISGCGGASSSPSPTPPSTTASGTYTLQIVATGGATSRSEPITLVVR